MPVHPVRPGYKAEEAERSEVYGDSYNESTSEYCGRFGWMHLEHQATGADLDTDMAINMPPNGLPSAFQVAKIIMLHNTSLNSIMKMAEFLMAVRQDMEDEAPRNHDVMSRS